MVFSHAHKIPQLRLHHSVGSTITLESTTSSLPPFLDGEKAIVVRHGEGSDDRLFCTLLKFDTLKEVHPSLTEEIEVDSILMIRSRD